MITHIVMFDFSQLDEEKINYLVEEFKKLSKLKEVLSFEWGVEDNLEGQNLDFTHCFTLTFAGFEARDSYLNSKEHREYESEVVKYRSKVIVFDYERIKVK